MKINSIPLQIPKHKLIYELNKNCNWLEKKYTTLQLNAILTSLIFDNFKQYKNISIVFQIFFNYKPN